MFEIVVEWFLQRMQIDQFSSLHLFAIWQRFYFFRHFEILHTTIVCSLFKCWQMLQNFEIFELIFMMKMFCDDNLSLFKTIEKSSYNWFIFQLSMNCNLKTFYSNFDMTSWWLWNISWKNIEKNLSIQKFSLFEHDTIWKSRQFEIYMKFSHFRQTRTIHIEKNHFIINSKSDNSKKFQWHIRQSFHTNLRCFIAWLRMKQLILLT